MSYEIVASERGRDTEYREEIARLNRERVQIDGAASFGWTRSGVARRIPRPDGELVGRVALSETPEQLERAEFYIGTTHLRHMDMEVFSWTAPVARNFYLDSEHSWAGLVRGVRSFVRGESPDPEIVDYSDELREGATGELFTRRSLRVAPAPSVPALPDLPQMPPADVDVAEESEPSLPIETAAKPTRLKRGIEHAVTRPKRGKLNHVLSTLQDDQFVLISQPPDRSMIIEGHPGTGKTIIATHRAAFLAEQDAERGSASGDPNGPVLLIGPTDDYVRHVTSALGQLIGFASKEVEVISLRQFLSECSGEPVPEGGAITKVEDGSVQLFGFARDAAMIARNYRDKNKVKLAYEVLRKNTDDNGGRLTNDPEWSAYLTALPTFQNARLKRSLAPLLAAIGVHLGGGSRFQRYRHIIVDEAQDVMHSEWCVIDAVNSTGRWTIVGDMNQRRSDASLHAWEPLADELGIMQDDGTPPVVTIDRGYRSTKQILDYAGRLLPARHRTHDAIITDGVEPQRTRVPDKQLFDVVVDNAIELMRRYEDGTVAVISVAYHLVEDVLGRRHWIKEPDSIYRWTAPVGVANPLLDANSKPRTLDIVSPGNARGLEWDAVVVVEPSDYPRNLGRLGLLYTSLTRANKELRVVYSGRLPDALTRN